MVKAAIEGKLEDAEMITDDIFGLHIPAHVPGVPDHILQPENTWTNKEEYKEKAVYLANEFKENFKVRTYRCHRPGRRPSRIKNKSQEQLCSWLVLIDGMQRSQLVCNDGPAFFPLKLLHFSCA